MYDFLAAIFLISIVAGIYFLIRLIIRAIFGGETSGYRTKLVISLGVIIISAGLFFFMVTFVGEDEEDMKEDATRILDELLEENFPSQKK